MISKKLKIALISTGGALVVGGGLGVGLGLGLNQNKDDPKKEQCPEGTCVDNDHDTLCDVCGYQCVFDFNHATKCKGDPNYSFQMGVGESKVIEATLDPVPYKYSERDFTWELSNQNIISYEINPEKSAQVTVKALKTGTVKLTATNTYNTELSHVFEIRVIKYDAESMYLWQYNTDAGDRAQFGYDSKINTSGTKSGTAILGGLKWAYDRSAVNSLQSDKGAIAFGKGKAPETSVKLVAKNDRKIKRVSIETASANGLATAIVKIGDTKVIEKATPASNDGIGEIRSSLLEDLEGDISIEFVSPEFDISKAEDPNYRAPGAVYLKSIFIEFTEKYAYKTVKSYDLAAKFNNPDDPDFSGLTGTAKPISMSDDDFEINFEKVAKPGKDDKVQGFALTNGYIDIKTKSDAEIIKSVEFNYENGTTANTYSICQSFVGGEPFTDKLISSKTGNIATIIYDKAVTAVRLAAGGTSKVGLKSINVKTIEGAHAEVSSVELKEGAKPDRDEFYTGEKFDSTGLGDIVISFVDNVIAPINYSTSLLTFYDGQSYNNPADHSAASEVLREGTTEVVAVFLNKEIQVDIKPVTTKTTTFAKVKSNEELASGSYLLTAPSKKAVLKGSASDLDSKAAVETLSTCDFGDSITLNYLVENEQLVFTKVGDFYNIKTIDGRKIGMTEKHALSITSTKDPLYMNWTISIDESGIATFKINDSESVNYYFGYGTSTFKLQDSNPSNVVLYKIAQ